MIITLLTALFAITTRFCVSCNPEGAPVEACSTLTPQHGSSTTVCTVDCPFTLTLLEIDMSSSTVADTGGRYACGSTHTIRLHGITDTETFRGFMVQPRVSTAQFNSSAAHVGTFLVSADTQTLSCDGNSPNTVTHVNNTDKLEVELLWVAPPRGATESVTFWLTVVINTVTYAVQLEGLVLEPFPESCDEVIVIAPITIITTLQPQTVNVITVCLQRIGSFDEEISVRITTSTGIINPINELLVINVSSPDVCTMINVVDDLDGSGGSGQFILTFELLFTLDPPLQGVTVVPSTALVINDDPSVPGSCVTAEYIGCCTDNVLLLGCQGLPANCFCDQVCFSFNDCCDDVEDIGCDPDVIVRFSEPVVYIREGETSIICIESTVNIGVVLDPPILDFSLSSTDDTATGGFDYQQVSLQSAFNVTQASDSVCTDIITQEDDVTEGIERFVISFSHATVPFTVDVIEAVATIEIIDNETPYRAEIRFTVSPITVREGVDPELDVCIQSIVSGDVHPLEPSFPLSFIVDGASTAEVNKDYFLISNIAVVTVSAIADTIGCISIGIEDDNEAEIDELIVIRLEADVTQLSADVRNGLSIDPGSLTIIIEDNDGFVKIELSFENTIISVREANLGDDICVRSTVLGQPMLPPGVDSLEIILSIDGNATLNEDYRVIGGLRGNLSLVFSDVFCVRGEIIDDFTLERNETIYITFDPVVESSMIPSNVTVIEQGVGGEVTIVIEDNENATLEIVLPNPAVVPEGTVASVCLELGSTNANSLAFDLTAIVVIQIQDVTAPDKRQVNSGDRAETGDFTFNSNEYVFTAGSLTTTRSVCNEITAVADDFIEETEIVDIVISPLPDFPNITIGASRTLSFSDTSISAQFEADVLTVNELDMSVMVCILLSPLLLETTATIQLQAQTNTANASDFSQQIPSVTFERFITDGRECSQITIFRDSILENDESFFVSCLPCADNSMCTTCDSSSTVTIQDGNDATLEIVLPNSPVVSEGSVASVCLELGSASANNLSFNLTAIVMIQIPTDIAEGAEIGDFTFNSNEYVFTAGSLTTTRSVCNEITAVADDFIEETEIVDIVISPLPNLPNLIIGQPRTLSSLDTSVSAQFEADVLTVNELDMSVMVCILLSPLLLETTATIQLQAETITATASDFSQLIPSVTFEQFITDGRECSQITIFQDDIYENDESFVVSCLPCVVNSMCTTCDGSSTVTIQDGDSLSVVFENTQYSAMEDSSSVEVCAILQGTTAVSIAITFVAEENPQLPDSRRAINGPDFQGSVETLTFGPDTSRICRSITVLDDNISEDLEEFQVTFTIPITPRVFIGSAAQVLIIDNDSADISFEQIMYTANEDEILEVCAVSSAELARTVSVNIDIGATGSAQNGMDYQLLQASLQFSGANQRSCINIELLNDLTTEGVETFTILLNTEEDQITLTSDSAAITIIDINNVNIKFQESSYTASEDGSVVTVCTVIDGVAAGGLAQDITVRLVDISSGQSAVVFEDYIFDGSGQSVFFLASAIANGDSACLDIPIQDDSDVEDDQQFQLEIVNASPGIITSPSVTTVTITDNADGTVSLPDELTFSETNGTVNICASLQTEGSLQTELIVTLTVEDGGTATLNEDYILNAPFVYSIGPDNNGECPSISIQDDAFLEGNQMLSVAVSSTNLNPNSIEIAMPRVVIIILDDEEGDVELLPIDAVPEGGVAQVCILLSCLSCQATDSDFNLEVLLEINSGTAVIGQDFTTDASQNIAISADDFNTERCIGILTNADMIVEANETFSVTIVSTNPSSSTFRIVNPGIQLAIIQDISRITATFGNQMQSVIENEVSLEVCIVLSNTNLERDIIITVATQSDTATDELDFTPLTQLEVVFGIGTTGTECFQVVVVNDDLLEDSERFQVTILMTPSDPAVDVPEPVLPITILDDDVVSVSFTADSYTVGEEELTLDVCLSLNGSTEVPVSVILSLQEDGQVPIAIRASFGMDFTPLENSEITLTSSQVPVCLSVTLVDDNVFEGSETFLLSMSATRERVLVDDPVQITIIDNDVAEIGFERVVYSTAEDNLVTDICILTSDNLGIMVTVDVALVSGSAQSGADFEPESSPSQRTFTSGGQRLCVDVTIVNDNRVEAEETFTALLSTSQERVIFTANETVIAIQDDEDFFVGFEQLSYNVVEDAGVVSVCAVITEAPVDGFENTPVVSLMSMDGNIAENQRDFVFDPNTELPFTAGSLSACIDIQILDDNDVEGDHDFEILITDVTLGTVLIASSVTTVTITDNLDGVLSLPTQLEASENSGNGGLEVCTSLSSGGVLETSFVVTLMTVDNSAAIGEDYSLSFPFVITYSAGGASEACTDIMILDDTSLEGFHSFSVEVTSTTLNTNAIELPSLPLLIRIQDDERASVRLLPIADVTEGQSLDVCVVAESQSAQTIGFDMMVTLTITDGSAINGADFTSNSSQSLIFPSGTEIGSQKCFSITTNIDSIVEGDQDFMVTLVDVNGDPADLVLIASPSVLSITIQDNTALTASFDNTMLSVTENELSVEACVSLSESALERDVVITATTEAGTAAEETDFSPVTLDVVFDQDTTTGRECFFITIVDDDVLEESETFQVTLQPRINTTIDFVESLLIVTIIDDDSVSVTFVEDYVVEEQEETFEVCVTLNGATAIDVAVMLSAQENNQLLPSTRATIGSDFNAIMDPELVFTTSSQGPLCRVVTLVNDDISEGTEFFLIVMSTSMERVGLDDAAGVTVSDDDSAVIGFEQVTYNVEEDIQFVRICVVSSVELERIVSVDIAMSSGSAESEDYVSQTFQPLVFTAVEIENCVDIEIVDDTIVETTEDFSLVLNTSEERVILSPNSTEIVITDNDFVTVSFEGDVMIQFISENASSKLICVVLSHTDLERDIVVTVSTEEGTASEIVDFVPIVAQDLVFTGDTERMCFPVMIVNDDILENTEVFRVLILPTNDPAILFENTVLNVGIENDDSVTINFEETGYFVNEDQSLEDVCVVLLGSIEINITVILSAEEDSTSPEDMRATLGSDFTMFTESELVFTPNNALTALCRRIPVLSDDFAEETEVFLIDLSSTNGNVASGSSVQVTIFDQDSASVGLEMVAYTVMEAGGTIEVCVVSSPELDKMVMVELTTQDGSAQSNIDYDPVTESLTLSFGAQRECINITIRDNDVVEDDRIFNVILSTTDQRLVLGIDMSEVLISDDDTVVANILQTTILAPEASEAALVCVFIGEEVARVLTFVITPNEDGTATGGDDFSLDEVSIVLTPPEINGCSPVALVDDNVREGEETFSVTLSPPDEAVDLRSSSAVVTIQDNDEVQIQLQNAFYDVNEGNSPLEVCVILTGEIETDITVTLTTSNITATPNDDYSPVNEDVVISPGQQSQCIDIAILDDDILESDETLSISLTADQLGVNIDVSEAIVTITDNDNAMLRFVDGQQTSYNEIDSVTVCATLSLATERTVVATITAQDGSAMLGADYSITSGGQFEFEPSATPPTSCFDGVIIEQDTLLEENEMFSLLLSSPDPSVVLDTSFSELTILILDSSNVQVGFQSPSYVGMESVGRVTVCAVINADIDRSVQLELIAVAGSANEQDYILPDNPVLFFSGSTAGTELCKNITIVNDGVREDETEEFSIMLTTQDPDVILQPDTAQVFIIDNDTISIEFAQNNYQTVEGESINICVVLMGQTDQPVQVTLTSQSNTATVDADYEDVSVNLMFSGGTQMEEVCHNVLTLEDEFVENTELFIISLTTSAPLVIIPINAVSVLIDDNDEVTLQFTQETFEVLENDIAGLVCVEIASGIILRSISFSVQSILTESTTAEVEDFVAVSEDREFTSQTQADSICIVIEPNDDMTLEEDETFLVTIEANSPVSTSSPRLMASVIIQNDDNVTINFEAATYSASEGEVVDACLILIGNTDIDVSATVQVVPGTASDTDYTIIGALQFIFNAETGSRLCIQINATGDLILEDDENFSLLLSTNVIHSSQPTLVTIIDDDVANVEFSAPSFTSIEESEVASVCITLLDTIEREVTVTLSANEQTNDIVSPFSGSFLVTIGESGRQFCLDVSVVDDEILEDTETYTLSLTSTDGDVAIATPTASLVILDTTDGITIGWEQNTYTVAEENLEQMVCATIIGLTEIFPRVSFTTTTSGSDTATTDVDFNSVSDELIFSAALTTVCEIISIINDQIPEPQETFQVQLTSTTITRAVIGEVASTTITITDTDRVSVGFRTPVYTVEESITMIEVCLDLSVPTAIVIDVTLSVVQDTALFGSDYSLQEPGTQSYSITFLPGEMSECRFVLILEDSLLEESEMFTMNLETTTPVADVEPSTSTVTILDNDNVIIGFVESSYAVGEEEESVSVCVVLTGQTAIALGITILTQVNSDITLQTDQVWVFSSSTSNQQCFDVGVIAENFVEFDETFEITLTTTNDAIALTPATTLITVTNDDFAPIEFDQTEYVISEGANTVTVCLTIADGILQRSVTISLSTSGISAEAGDDFTQTVTELVFSPTTLEHCVDVGIMDDAIVEDTEQFLVTVDSNDPVIFTTNSVVVSILDNQDSVTVGLQSPSYEDTEGSTLSVCVELFGTIQRSVTVSMVITDGSANGGQDFTPVAVPNLVFQDGQELCTNIMLIDDSIHEDQETFTIAITTTDSAANLGTSAALVTISDNDDASPRFAAGTHPVNENVQQVQVCIVLDIPTERSILLSLTTQDESATAPNDYTSLSQVVTLQPAANSQTVCIPVAIIDDQVLEAMETFFLTLETSDPRVSLTPENSRASVTITDNDNGIVIAGFEQSEYDVSESDLSLSVCATQLASIERDVGVVFSAVSQSAIIGVDFMAQTVRLTFLSGQTQQRLCYDISITNDQLLENNEMFQVLLMGDDSDLIFSPNSATVTIVDSSTVTVRFESTNYVFEEGGVTSNTVCAVSSGANEIAFTVRLSTNSGTAQESTDYRSIESIDLVFAVATNQVCTEIIIFDDEILENDETFTISMESLSESVLVLTDSSTVTITDNNVVTVNWDEPDYSVLEGDVRSICASVQQPTEREFIVDIVVPITEDFSTDNSQLTFLPTGGPQTRCCEVTITRDDGLEEMEIFSLSLESSDEDVFIGPVSVTQIIITNIDVVTVSFQPPIYTVTEGQMASVCAVITGTSNIPVNIIMSTTQVTAEVTDFGIPVPSQLVFNVGVTSVCTSITTDDDTTHEENESFSVALSSTTNNVNVGISTATVLITDNDDAEVTWQQAQYFVIEGNTISVCAVLFIPTERIFTIDIVAPTSEDFNIEEFQLTFSPSQSPQTRCTNVMSVADNRLEGNEVFSLTLVTSEFSVIIEPTAVTSITVQDDTDFLVSLEQPSYIVMEGQTVTICAVIESGIQLDTEVSLSLSTTQVTAEATSDYEEPPSELVIQVGDTMDCVDIATVNDDIYEENEQLSVALSSTTLGVGIAQGTATVEITDNDDVSVRWSQSEYSTNEGSTIMVCAEQPEQTERAFSVNVIVPNSEDLVVALFQLPFPPGEGPQTSCTDVTITNNDGLENEETFVLTLESSDPTRVIIGVPAITSIVITNTDGIIVSFQFSQFAVLEGESVTVCASIVAGTSNIAFTLELNTALVTAEVADISPPPSQLVFSVDGITTCTTIQTQNDAVYEDNEQFMLSLIPTNPSISIGVGLTTVEITDNDGVTVNWEQVEYPTSEGSVLTVCAVQPQLTERDFIVTINVPTNSDFTVEGDPQLNFPSGGESQMSCADVMISDDLVFENEETFCLTLESSDADVTVGPSGVTCIVISDNDNLEISFEEPSYAIMEGETLRICAVITSGINAVPVSIDIDTADGTAQSPEFGDPVPAQLVFNVGMTSVCTDIATVNDEVHEDNESFSVALSSTNNRISFAVGTATVQIIDNDRVVVNWEQLQYTATEGDTRSVCAVQLDPSEKQIIANISATPSDEFSIEDMQLIFPPVGGSQTICTDVTIASDDLLEAEESFCLTLTSLEPNVIIGLNAAVTCIAIEDASAVNIGFSMPTHNVQESSESVDVCVSLVGNTAIPITIDFSTMDGSATEPDDYMMPTEDVVFIGDGPQEQCISIAIVNDDILEDTTESFTVLIASDAVRGVTLNPSSAVVNIVGADDIIVGLQAIMVSVEEGNTVMVCAELVGQIEITVEVTIMTESSGLAEAGSDYSEVTDILTFVSGQLVQCVELSALLDNVLEEEESLSVLLTNANSENVLLMPNQATVVITDQTDVTVGLTQTTYTVQESMGDIEVCASLIGMIARDVNVRLSTVPDSAEGGSDFTSLAGDVRTFLPSSQPDDVCWTISIINDDNVEGQEIFLVNINSDDIRVTLNPDTAQVIIMEEDSITAQFNQSVYSSSEEDGQVTVFILVQGQSEISFELQLQTVAGSATSNDFDNTVQLVPIQAPFFNVLLSHIIQIENDNIAELTETFSVVLSSNDDHIIVPVQTSTAEITIADTDTVNAGFTSANYVASERDGEVQVCIELSGETQRDLFIALDVSGGTATEGADYNIEPFSVEITASETVSLGTVCHSIVLIGDDLIEADETIQLQLITANSFINFIIDSAVVIIQDVSDPSDDAIANTLMDISAIVSNGTQTEENFDRISDTLNNLANVIENQNIVVNETTLASVSDSVASISVNWPAEVLQNSTASSLEIVEAVRRIGIRFTDQLSDRSANFCVNGLFVLATRVNVNAVDDLNLNSDCVDNVPASNLVSMTIPSGIFAGTDPGMELSVVFTLYESSTLFPDENNNADIRVNTSVIGAVIEPLNTDNLSENVTIEFQLNRSSNFIQCVFYNFSESRWSSEGCTTIVNHGQIGNVACLCDHLTNFALQLSNEEIMCEQQVVGGGFLCGCDSGYLLNADGRTCSDINECLNVVPVCDDNANCSNTDGSFECTCRTGYMGSGRECEGIPPLVSILERLDANPGNPITVRVEPGRPFSLTCESSEEFPGDVIWTLSGGSAVPTEETEEGVLFRSMHVPLSENGNVSRESLVAGIGGIQPIAEGENNYVCTATNDKAATTISVLINVPELDDPQVSSFLRFSTETSLESIAQSVQIPLSRVFDYIDSVALSSIDADEPGHQEFNCNRVPTDLLGAMERVECQFNNYDSDLPLDAGRIENLTNVLVDNEIISPTANITVSDNGFCDDDETNDELHGRYQWPETRVGETRSLPCNFGGPNVNPVAMRTCESRGVWTVLPEYGECYTFVTMMYVEINIEEVEAANLVVMIGNLADLVAITASLEDQSQNNFVVILNVVSTTSFLVGNNNFNDTDLGEVVSSVTNILDDVQLWPEDEIQQNGVNLVELLEDVASALAVNAEIGNGTTETVLSVTGNTSALVVERNDISTLQMLGRQFSASRVNDELSIMPSTNNSENQIASIQLPASLFEETAVLNSGVVGDGIGLVFTAYSSPVLFPLANGSRPSVEVRSSIIGALLGGLPVIRNLTDPIVIILEISLDDEEVALEASCVSWDFRAAGGLGNWTTEGCNTTLDRESGVVVCMCNHLTNFATLVDVCSRTERDCLPTGATETALEVISYIGVTLSVIGLILTIVSMLAFKKLKARDASKFHVQLSLSLLCMLLVFVVGIDRTEVFEGCVTVSVLIHYFTLVAVMFMGAEALLMFQKLVIVFVQITTRYIIIVSLVCWLVPIVPVVIPLSINPRFMVSIRQVESIFPNTTNEDDIQFCFIGETGVFFGAFLVPIFAVLIFNCVIFSMVIRVLIKHSRKKFSNKKDKNAAENVKRLLISIFGIMCLFGLTWFFGALTISDASIVFQFFFAFFNSLQGFFIFMFFCVLGKETRELWLQFLCRGRKIRWITTSTAGSRPRKGTAPASTSDVSGTVGSSGTTNTQLRSSSLDSIYLRRPSGAPSIGADFVSSIEMDPMESTITNLHAIEEEDEEVEDGVSYDMEGSVALDLSQSMKNDISHSSTMELIGKDYSRRSSTSDAARDQSGTEGDGLKSPPRKQDTVLSPGSSATSNADSEIIENPHIENEDDTD